MCFRQKKTQFYCGTRGLIRAKIYFKSLSAIKAGKGGSQHERKIFFGFHDSQTKNFLKPNYNDFVNLKHVYEWMVTQNPKVTISRGKTANVSQLSEKIL